MKAVHQSLFKRGRNPKLGDIVRKQVIVFYNKDKD